MTNHNRQKISPSSSSRISLLAPLFANSVGGDPGMDFKTSILKPLDCRASLAMTGLCALIFLFIFCLAAKPVLASPYGMSIQPPLLRVQIKPGKSITQIFSIANLNADDKFFVARIVPFTKSDDLGNPTIDPKKQASWQKYFSLANSFIKLDEPFTVKGGSTEQLIVSISIPDTAPLQDIYATLLVSTYSNTAAAEYQGSVVSATIGSNLLITICSDLNPATLLRIENFVVTSGTYIKIGNTYFADNISPLSFSANIKNNGNYTAETKGLFRIVTKNDSPVFLDGILPVYVISKNSRKLLSQEGDSFAFAPTLSQIGSYRAVLEIKTDNSNSTSSVDIIFIPLKALAGLIMSFIIVITIISFTKKNNK
jgi:hypothetical protein